MCDAREGEREGRRDEPVRFLPYALGGLRSIDRECPDTSDNGGSIENASCRSAIAPLGGGISILLGEDVWRKRGKINTDCKFVSTRSYARARARAGGY